MESWKDIIGYEGLYKISDKGRVKVLNRRYKSKPYLKPYATKGLYFRVALTKNKKQETLNIHRLLGIHFIKNTGNGTQINHIDGNKLNNDLKNLEWVTPSQNIQFAYDIGLCPQGEKHGMAKFTYEIIDKIRKEYVFGKRGSGCRVLGRKYGMSKTNILDIVNNRIWREVI